MGNMMTLLVNSEQTGGAFSMTEYLSKPTNEPPAHMHDREDEYFYVLEGRVDAYIGKEVFRAGPNEGAYFPEAGSTYVQYSHPAFAEADFHVAGRIRRILPRHE
jgi:hypothetical protein